ncbi:MAG TPA: hypothetical protein VIF64_04890 [Pyrinomonadaceae bacterium]|jgi:hypothetical protein
MTESSLLILKLTPRVLMQELNFRGWNLRSGGAVFGLCLGILSALIGSVFTAISWFTGPHWHGFSISHYGTVLLFLTIPLLLIGGHCLDLMEQQDKESSK